MMILFVLWVCVVYGIVHLSILVYDKIEREGYHAVLQILKRKRGP